ncbi:MAG: GspE/PulE family protein [Hydrogenothermaceae bacterium]|nr:GspE/PulE family protein [Hydrogenothermaceae bacterium]
MSVKVVRNVSTRSFQEILKERFGIDEQELKKLQEESLTNKKSLLKILLDKGYSEEDICKIKAEYLGYRFDKLSDYEVPGFVKEFFSKEFLKSRLVLPIKYENNSIVLALYEPTDIMTINQIVDILNQKDYKVSQVDIVVSTKSQIEEKIESLFENEEDISKIMHILKNSLKDFEIEEKIEREKPLESSSPIITLANKLIEEAFLKKASDIHIQPLENKFIVRYRIDGDIHTVLELPKVLQDAIITRYKIMSDMKIDEKRVPQDGRIDFYKYNSSIPIDLRVSTIPTIYGEDVVMRILQKKTQLLNLDNLGFTLENMKLYRETISKPYGLILHTGPTGSGKTTTLYAALNEVNKPDVKILTVEDPVEYSMGGMIVQTSVNNEAGYTFAKALKAFLRHDPDIILVGEIRDIETAKICVEASLTGHLVFSTLHTNDAVSTITRLREMGIESYLIADSLLLVVAQRLAKRLCENCKERYIPSKKEKAIIEKAGFTVDSDTYLYRGSGCRSCNFTGYKGRVGIHELLYVSSRIKELMIQNATTDEILKVALAEGMKTLRQDGVLKVLQGITTLEEVEKTVI